MRRDYVLIVGHGRSGTNFLLQLLDLSPDTHCRNEPDELSGSAFARLPSGTVRIPEPGPLETGWDAAVAWAATRMGERDPFIRVPKRHLRETSRRIGAYRALRSPRVARLLGPLVSRPEWTPPVWLARPREFGAALPVLKLNQVPGWAAWVLRARPAVRVLHIVRHPGGFLNSWSNRWLAQHDRGAVRAANHARLERVGAVDPSWGARFGEIDALSVEESELWYWRYATETIHAAGAGAAGYRRVDYEALTADPLGEMAGIYAFCGLDFDDAAARGVRAQVGSSQSIARAWRAALAPPEIDLVERILADGPLQGWWPDAAGTVS